MRIVCDNHPPGAVRSILGCLGLPTRAPPIAAAASDRDEPSIDLAENIVRNWQKEGRGESAQGSAAYLPPAILKLRPNIVTLRSVLSYNPAAEEITGMLPREFASDPLIST